MEQWKKQWEKWNEIVGQIKDIEWLITQSDESSEHYSAHLAELRSAEAVARNQLESLLKSMQG